jgi:hypothetical protein
MRRLAILIGSGILAIALVGPFTDRADGQKEPRSPSPLQAQGQPSPDLNSAGPSSVKFIENSQCRRVINVGRDCIHDKEWNQAIDALQKVLDEKKDYFVQVTEPDPANKQKEITRWTSAKFEANNLIGSMPLAGLQAYEAKHGAEARTMLDAAKKKKDGRELLAEMAQRFRHTKAGTEAHEILAAQFKASAVVDVVNVKDWPSWRGNATNTGQAAGNPPLLDTVLWKRPIFMDKLDGTNEQDPDQNAQARVNIAIKQGNDLKQPVLPGSFPIAARGMMVYRSPRDVRAVALKEIGIKDDESGEVFKCKAGEIVWKSIPFDRSLAVLLAKPKTGGKTEQWLDAYEKVPGFNSFLYDNTLIGTLTTDGRYVYSINDLAVPPHPGAFALNQFNPQLKPFQLGEMKPLVLQNDLNAYDLINGKLKWDLTELDPQFKNSHFLGLPITVGGKLYVLNETLINPNEPPPNRFGGKVNPIGGESELRLICIDPSKLVIVNGNTKPAIETIQALGNVAQNNRMVQDIGRRVNAVQLAYRDGVLVCPTNAGEVFGIDVRTRSLVWSYPYRENQHQPIVLPGMAIQPVFPPKGIGNVGTTTISKWKSSPPAIEAGKIVFTAPDADSVHCISLRDGKRIWMRGQQKGDLYMAGVFAGRVLIVGHATIRALDLKNGSQLWSTDTSDLPSGQGAASNGIYYLPLKKGEILAVDVVKGEIKARHHAKAGAPSPGNLIFYENMVLSQTPTEVMAYPQERK